jgi:hypothetical protein
VLDQFGHVFVVVGSADLVILLVGHGF